MAPQDWIPMDFTRRIQGVPARVAAQVIESRQASTTDIHESKTALLYGVTLTFWILALFTVFIRIYARSFLTKFRGQDDWWMLAASVFAAGDQCIKIIWLSNGLGQHVAVVPLDQLMTFAMCGYVIAVLYPWSLGLVKISILCFYLRLFPHENFRKWCYFMMAVVTAVTVSISFAQIFPCKPIASAWMLEPLPGTTCIDRQSLQYVGSVLNLVTDLVILLMPMKYFLKLSGDSRKRYIVVVLFSLGLITCIASALRLQTIHAFYVGSDPTWDATDIAIWSCIEINLTIITASIPAIKPVFIKFLYRPIRRSLGYTVSDSSLGDTKDASEISTEFTSTLSRTQTRASNMEAGYKPPLTRRGSSFPALGDWGEESDEEEMGANRGMDFYTVLQTLPPTPGAKSVDLNPLNNPAAFRSHFLRKDDRKDSEITIEELTGDGTSASEGSSRH